MHLSALYLHPLKSAASLACEHIELTARGPRHDRRWMLVDDAGRFVSGRQLGALVRLRATPIAGGLRLAWQGEQHEVATPAADAPRLPVTVWQSTVDAALADPASHAWLSARLDRALRLVFMDAAAQREVDRRWLTDAQPLSFADGFPLLLIGQASLDDLNSRLARPLGMRSFRPNLVVSGAAAYAEENWRRLRIGGIDFAAVKPCTRCVFTTVDPDSGERDPTGEPLATLKTYRRSALGITFGMNLVARGHGRLALGDRVELLDCG